MPLTPTHLGPSLFLFSLKPRLFNFWALLLGSALMDFENVFWTLINALNDCPRCPHHGFFHSILGAIFGSFILAFILRKLAKSLDKISLKLGLEQSFSLKTLFLSGLLGWTLHVLADSLVHRDVFIFWPLKTTPLLISWSLYWPLSFGFTILGLFSMIILLIRIVKGKKT
ncbi:MAG: DUF4184 family protein [Candidatus Nealsonbacteria bacterium]|nr:DUF4184 family protein [Candidatus Nealsonbacteria bacterium]